MIASIWAREGDGKTSFALSFPKPLFHLDLDIGGFDRAIWRIAETADKGLRILKLGPKPLDEMLVCDRVTYNSTMKLEEVNWDEWDIVSKPYAIPIQKAKLLGIQQKQGVSVRFPRRVIGVKEVWQETISDIVTVCETRKVRTINDDSQTRHWWICHQGFLQEKQEIQLSKGIKEDDKDFREQLSQIEYPNDRMYEVIYAVKSFGVDLVMTHYPADVYADKIINERKESYKTGELKPDGFKHTVKVVDIVLWCYTEKDNRRELVKGVPNPDYGKPVPRAEISLKCGLPGMGMKAVGLELPTPSYEGLMELQSMMRGEA